MPAASGTEGRGPITYVQGKDNSGLLGPMAERWNADPPQREGHGQGAVRPGRPAARRPRAALPGQGPQLRRRLRRRGVGGGVRRQGLADAAQGQVRPRHQRLPRGAGQGLDLQQDALRRPDLVGRRDALLPLRPGEDPAEDHRRDVGHVLHRQAERHGLLRGPVRQVRGRHLQRDRVDERLRRQGRRRRGQAHRRLPRGRRGPQGARRPLQERRHPQAGDHLPGGAEPGVLPGRQAAVPAQLALRLQPGQRPTPAPRSRASSRSPRSRASTAPAPRPSVATRPRSAPTPRTRPRPWTS